MISSIYVCIYGWHRGTAPIQNILYLIGLCNVRGLRLDSWYRNTIIVRHSGRRVQACKQIVSSQFSVTLSPSIYLKLSGVCSEDDSRPCTRLLGVHFTCNFDAVRNSVGLFILFNDCTVYRCTWECLAPCSLPSIVADITQVLFIKWNDLIVPKYGNLSMVWLSIYMLIESGKVLSI